MRRFFLILTPVLLLALAACGGTTNKQADVAPTPEPRVLAEGSGLANGQPPRAAQQTQVLVSQPDKAVEGLTISDINATVGSDGMVLISGKIGNGGKDTARTTSIAVEIVDGSGNRVSRQQFAYPTLPLIYPGDQVAWQGQTQLKLTGDQKVQVAIAGEPVGAQ